MGDRSERLICFKNAGVAQGFSPAMQLMSRAEVLHDSLKVNLSGKVIAFDLKSDNVAYDKIVPRFYGE